MLILSEHSAVGVVEKYILASTRQDHHALLVSSSAVSMMQEPMQLKECQRQVHRRSGRQTSQHGMTAMKNVVP